MAISKRLTTQTYHSGVDEVINLLKTYSFVAVWVGPIPKFAVDRSFTKQQIIKLFSMYISDCDAPWYDGSE